MKYRERTGGRDIPGKRSIASAPEVPVEEAEVESQKKRRKPEDLPEPDEDEPTHKRGR